VNRATEDRLEQLGLWTPQPKTEDERLRQLLAERSSWIKAVGLTGWRREQDRRRAQRLANHRQARAARTGSHTREPAHE
jgi:hypothetical protein